MVVICHKVRLMWEGRWTAWWYGRLREEAVGEGFKVSEGYIAFIFGNGRGDVDVHSDCQVV